MATDVLGAQPHGLRFRETDLDPNMACELYNLQDGWAALPNGGLAPFTAANYVPFSAGTAEEQFASKLVSTQEPPLTKDSTKFRDEALRSCAGFGSGTAINTSGTTIYNAPAVYPSSVFTAFIAPSPAQDVTAISSIQTRFDQDKTAPTSNRGLALDTLSPSTEQSKFIQSSVYLHQAPLNMRSDSKQMNLDGSMATMKSNIGRRRRTESVVTGSARAVYLEKNRKAASKCRSKQKRQQEELVQIAREVERRNRLLKAEVEMLRGGMRELMDIVSQHSDCPDNRLKLYVQREADRLANGGIVRTAYLSPTSQTMFSQTTVPPETISSPSQDGGDSM
jgi:cyclic AMP-dependent transcription factor ATF-2